jgi:hypothetical protein
MSSSGLKWADDDDDDYDDDDSHIIPNHHPGSENDYFGLYCLLS